MTETDKRQTLKFLKILQYLEQMKKQMNLGTKHYNVQYENGYCKLHLTALLNY